MEGMVGADLAEMHELAAAFERSAREVRRVEWLATSRLFMAGWSGADIDDVRLRWNSGCRPGLRNAENSLNETARRVRFEAEQQRRASDAGFHYARSINDSRDVRDLWNSFVDGGQSLLQALGGASADVIVSVARLVDKSAVRLGAEITAAAHRAVQAVDWLGARTLESARWAGGVVAGVGVAAIDRAVHAGVWLDQKAGQAVGLVQKAIGWSAEEVVKPYIERKLLEGYDFLSAATPLGELLELTANASPVDSSLSDAPSNLDGATVYGNLAKLSNGDSQIEVQTVIGADGQPRYVVYLRGTQQWLPGSNNPVDIMSNLEVGLQYDDSAYSHAVERALINAGVPDGAEVVLAGHSLGGLTAVQLARDSDFTDRYSVKAVFTAGAGSDLTPPPPEIRIEALRHYNDPVSWIGYSEPVVRGAPGQFEHWSNGPLTGPTSYHDMKGYASDAENLEGAGRFDEIQAALPGFFGPEAVVVESQGFEAQKLPFIGDDPPIDAVRSRESQVAQRL